MPERINKEEIIEELRSFMFYESYRDAIIGIAQISGEKTANELGWEILYYGYFGKRKSKLSDPYAEAAMRYIQPLIDKSVKRGEESLERIRQDDLYVRKMILERVSSRDDV